MESMLFLDNSITSWYPTFLGQKARQTLPFLVAFNAGGIVGGALCGR